MSIALVQGNVNPGQGTSTTYTCVLPGTVTAGNLVVMGLTMSTTGKTYVSTSDDINGTTGWAKDFGNTSLGARGNLLVSNVVATGGASMTITITVNAAAGTSWAFCGEFSSTTGWPATHLDTSASGSCTSSCSTTLISTATFSGAQAEELIVAWEVTDAAKTTTHDTGFSDISPTDATSASLHSEYHVTSSTWTTTAVNYTLATTASNWGIAAAIYKNTAAAADNRRVIVI